MSGKTELPQNPASRRLPSRFGVVFLFTVLYSIQRFLVHNPVVSEAAVLYPFLYLIWLVLDVFSGLGMLPLEVWVAVNAAWILVISRPLFILPALILFGVVLWSVRRTIWAAWSILLLGLMCLATILVRA